MMVGEVLTREVQPPSPFIPSVPMRIDAAVTANTNSSNTATPEINAAPNFFGSRVFGALQIPNLKRRGRSSSALGAMQFWAPGRATGAIASKCSSRDRECLRSRRACCVRDRRPGRRVCLIADPAGGRIIVRGAQSRLGSPPMPGQAAASISSPGIGLRAFSLRRVAAQTRMHASRARGLPIDRPALTLREGR
jgi:hypothetical protein